MNTLSKFALTSTSPRVTSDSALSGGRVQRGCNPLWRGSGGNPQQNNGQGGRVGKATFFSPLAGVRAGPCVREPSTVRWKNSLDSPPP